MEDDELSSLSPIEEVDFICEGLIYCAKLNFSCWANIFLLDQVIAAIEFIHGF